MSEIQEFLILHENKVYITIDEIIDFIVISHIFAKNLQFYVWKEYLKRILNNILLSWEGIIEQLLTLTEFSVNSFFLGQ